MNAWQRSGVLVAIALAVAVMAACSSSATPNPAATGEPSTSAPLAGAQGSLPAGWKRFSYGSLSVGAPKTWRINTTPLLNCSPPPPHTVSEYTLTRVSLSNCGMQTESAAAVNAVAIECLRDQANGLYSGSATTTVVRGTTMFRNGTIVWLQGPDAEGVVFIPETDGPSSLARTILASVVPTGRPC